MSDSMEMMVLSVLGPALSCDWDVTEWQKATMTVVIIKPVEYILIIALTTFLYWILFNKVIFVGMGVSSPLWGRISDKHGRKIVIKNFQ